MMHRVRISDGHNDLPLNHDAVELGTTHAIGCRIYLPPHTPTGVQAMLVARDRDDRCSNAPTQTCCVAASIISIFPLMPAPAGRVSDMARSGRERPPPPAPAGYPSGQYPATVYVDRHVAAPDQAFADLRDLADYLGPQSNWLPTAVGGPG